MSLGRAAESGLAVFFPRQWIPLPRARRNHCESHSRRKFAQVEQVLWEDLVLGGFGCFPAKQKDGGVRGSQVFYF